MSDTRAAHTPRAPAGPCLLGLGTARPQRTWDQVQALAFARARGSGSGDRARSLEALYRRAGVRQRGIATDDAFYPTHDNPSTGRRMAHYLQLALPMAEQASRSALTDAHCPPDEITHLVSVSCTGFTAPGLDLALVGALRLPPTVTRAHVGFMGCHGLLNALAVARGFATDPSARVLVCAAEVCSLHFRYDLPAAEAVSHALFADGAAALVLGPGDGWRLRDTASLLLPGSSDAMSWVVGDHGFEMGLSPQVPEVIAQRLPPWLAGWLRRHELEPGGVRSWAVHPGGPRVLDAVERALQLPRSATEVSRRVLSDCGNMSSATVGFLLAALRAAHAPTPCVALAFGPGLVAEAALFDA